MAFDPVSFAADTGANLVNTAISLVSQNHQNKVNAREAAKQREWASFEAQKQRDYSTEMWNKSNEYNTPEAQKQRMIEAGLSPWLALEGGVQSAPATPATPAGAPSGSSASVGSSVVNGSIGSLYPALVQSSLFSAEGLNRDVDTLSKLAEAHGKLLDSGVPYKEANEVFDKYMKRLGHEQDYIDKLRMSINYNHVRSQVAADRESLEYFLYNEFGREKAKADLAAVNQTIEESQKKVEVLESEKNVNEKRIDEIAQNAALALAKTLTENQSRDLMLRILEGQARMYENDVENNSFIGSDNVFVKLLNTIVAYLSKFIKFGFHGDLNK